jgi:hypothetical protein
MTERRHSIRPRRDDFEMGPEPETTPSTATEQAVPSARLARDMGISITGSVAAVVDRYRG